ncbi:WXG100 family type VII secretion target [Streptomyces meridianus]|uniref:WXG100 family type VII secretion target n=1 Tax=Streptomyces meridianus TaxID=2938945 RepID=A0ABT0XD40_9ACTN|nr:WXG100 family type VII secretion target [Streptomyces meridianus]MCM2579843.1 WXG100 family type VII secretion target [Streptomyces meridianus]
MPNSEFYVDPAVLKQQGDAFVNIGADFTAASRRLQADLDKLGEPWADADFGDIFGDVYTPIRDGMFTSMDSLGERLETIGDNLNAMGKKYSAADLDGVTTMSQVQRPLV